MSFKEQRKSRASQFISVRNFLSGLAESGCVSIQDAAGELLCVFSQPGSNPAVFQQDQATLLMNESDFTHLRSLLNTVSKHGIDWSEMNFHDASELDGIGWNREEIGTFSLAFLGCLPCCCSADWAPNELNTPATDHCLDSLVEVAHEMQGMVNYKAYSTPLIELLKAAIDEFYMHPRNRDPKKSEVVEWLGNAAKLLGIGLTKHMASTIFTIIKSPDHNPKKRMG